MGKGHFANIMADGKLRRVDYIADNQGFHILRDTADNTGKYIKREAETSVEPDLIRTRMSSHMDSSSLRNDNNMHQMSNNQMGRDMSSSMMQRNKQLTSNMYRANNLMGRDMSTMNMMDNDMSSMNNMMGQGLDNMMGHDMSYRNNMMGPDMSSRNNMVGHDMSSNQMLSSNTMGLDMNRMAPLNTMSQRMQIE